MAVNMQRQSALAVSASVQAEAVFARYTEPSNGRVSLKLHELWEDQELLYVWRGRRC